MTPQLLGAYMSQIIAGSLALVLLFRVALRWLNSVVVNA